jgi:hypothetical protein
MSLKPAIDRRGCEAYGPEDGSSGAACMDRSERYREAAADAPVRLKADTTRSIICRFRDLVIGITNHRIAEFPDASRERPSGIDSVKDIRLATGGCGLLVPKQYGVCRYQSAEAVASACDIAA